MTTLLVALIAIFCAGSAAYCARIAARLAPYRARWMRAVALLEQLDAELDNERTYARTVETEAARVLDLLQREHGKQVEAALRNAREIDERAAYVSEMHRAIQKEIDAKRAEHRGVLDRNLDTIMSRREK